MILTSLCCGFNGTYNACGVPVRFEHRAGETPSWFTQLFSIVFKNYDHTFMHEMGHAWTAKWLLSDSNPRVTIYTSECCPCTNVPRGIACAIALGSNGHTTHEMYSHEPIWKDTIVNMAGPIAGIAYSFCKLIVGIALQNIFWPAALVLAATSIYPITMDLIDAFRASLNPHHPDYQRNDFAQIAQNGGCVHLVCALAVLVIEVALGILLVYAIAI